MKRFAQLLFVLLITISCHHDPTEEPVAPYFELDVTTSYPTAATDNWVIVHNENGQVLGFGSFESGDHITFDSTVIPKKIGVTLLEVENETGYFSMNTYLDQEVKSKWTLKREPPFNESEGSYVGPLNVTVSDPNLGSIYDSNITGKAYTTFALPTTNGPEIKFSEVTATTAKKLLIHVTDKEGNPYYKMLEPGVAGNHTYSLQDFSQYEKNITISFPSASYYSLQAYGYEPGQNTSNTSGYNTGRFWDFTGVAKSSFKVGFTSKFPLYRIGADASYSNYALHYLYYGPAFSTNVQLKNDITASVKNNTFLDIAYVGNDYVWSYSTWWAMGTESSVGFASVTNSNKANKNLQSIPLPIAIKYPNVNLQKFGYSSTSFYKGTQPYATYIAELYKAQAPKPYELRYKSIWQ